MKDLIKKLINGDVKRSPEFDLSICKDTRVKVFTAETSSLLCKIWNTSNNNSFDTDYVCKKIANELLDDEDACEGTVSYNFNEIMFEITEK